MGELRGKQLEPRTIARLCYEQGWRDARDLVTAVAVCLSESQGFDRAYNDNVDSTTGDVRSRDCGLFQINIPASKIGTDEEERLYADHKYNVQRAWTLFTAAWTGGTTRRFQPWVAFTKNVYTRDTYLERATRGVGNYLAEWMFTLPTDDLNNDGVPYQHSLDPAKPVLNLHRRVEILAGGVSRSEKKLRELKALTPAPVDVKINEVLSILSTARNEAKK